MINTKNSLKRYVSMTALGVAMATSHGAFAQDAEESTGKGFTLEEIQVTARKVSENQQDVPISIAAFTGDGLERRQIFKTDKLDDITPGLQFSNNAPLAANNSSSQVFIRGIGQTDPTATVDPGVGIYIDDVYMGQSVGGTMDFRDIAGVQVLRGPQGTLFGRNTIGGAIVLTTVEPGDEFGVNLKASTGSDNLRQFFVGVDVPMSDTVKSRFTFGSKDQNGYVHRPDGTDLGDSNNYTFTGKLVFTPSDDLTVKMNFDYSHADENGVPLVFAAANEEATFMRVASAYAGCPGFTSWTQGPVPMIDDDRCANDFQNKGPYENNGSLPLESKLEGWGASFHIIYDASDAWTLKSITAYRDLTWEGVRDADNTPLTILHTDYNSDGWQFSQELQALYTGDHLKGVMGVYYFEEEINDIVTVTLAPPPAPAGALDSDNTITANDSWAVFTQWTYDVTNQLAVTVGGRYTSDGKASTPDQFNYANPSAKYLEVKEYSDTFTAFTMSANASYRFNDQFMAYASFSQGYKGGGWNSHFNAPQNDLALLAQIHPFEDEKANTYEIGFKADLADNTLRLNGALFTTDYKDLQLTYRFGVAPFILNAGTASIDGFELEMTWVPTEKLIIDAGIGYLSSSIDEVVEFTNAVTAVAAGNTLPFAPEWQGNVGAGYVIDAGNDISVTPRVDMSFQSKTYFDAINTEETAQQGTRVTFDASINIEPYDGQWAFTVGVTNLGDELYPIAGVSSLGTGSGYAEIAYARPREWFASFSYDF